MSYYLVKIAAVVADKVKVVVAVCVGLNTGGSEYKLIEDGASKSTYPKSEMFFS